MSDMIIHLVAILLIPAHSVINIFPLPKDFQIVVYVGSIFVSNVASLESKKEKRHIQINLSQKNNLIKPQKQT